jgi:hypothetical protein
MFEQAADDDTTATGIAATKIDMMSTTSETRISWEALGYIAISLAPPFF